MQQTCLLPPQFAGGIGDSDGAPVDVGDGPNDGAKVGLPKGTGVGAGVFEMNDDGACEGFREGMLDPVGSDDGITVGLLEGTSVGLAEMGPSVDGT